MKLFAKKFTSLFIMLTMLLTELLPFGCVYGEQTVENDLSVGSSQGFTSNETLQDSSELDSSIAKDIDIVEQEGFISGQLTDVTRSNDGLSINYSKISIREGYSFQLTSTAPSGANIDWHSNNTSVATVSGGNVTAVKAGKATIMVSYFDSSSNFQSATCTVYVVPSNIGVCYIKNNNSNLYLNLKDGKITNNTQIIQYTKYTTSNSNYNEYRVRQLWRVTYMDDGYYSIRPYAKSDRAIFANGNNTCINTAGYSDTLSDMLSFKWTIKWDGFQYNDSDSYTMQVYNGATTSSAIIKASSYSADNKCRWTFTKVTDGPNGLMMYTSNGSPLINSPQTKYIAPESTKTLVQMDYQPVCYARVNLTTLRIYQNAVRWYSSSTSKANVDSTTGAVTGVSEGSATIEAKVNMGVVYSVGYTLNVTSIAEGTYFIVNNFSGMYAGIEYEIMSSGTPICQCPVTKDASQRWRFALLSDGYYTIKSQNSTSSYYFGVENNSIDNSSAIVLVTSSSGNGAKWNIQTNSDGTYKITPKSGEVYGYDMAVDADSIEGITLGGTFLCQRDYTDDASYVAEWDLVKTKDKAIVIVPGMLGSELQESNGNDVWGGNRVHAYVGSFGMGLDENGNSKNNNINSVNNDNYGADDTYSILYENLYNAYYLEFDVIFFDYDFRMSNSLAATKLQNEVSCYDEVVIVAHSMGGLVSAKYLSNSAFNRNKTSALISLGTPYLGSAKSAHVMEGGGMLSGVAAVVNPQLSDMSVNSFAAYELLPTVNYEDITYEYPVKVNGQYYSNAMQVLQNTTWAKKASGDVKPMFSSATNFHSSLFNSEGIHVTQFTDVPIYTISGGNEDTIATVVYDSEYKFVDLEISNSGDGTVLWFSAGYGVPYLTYNVDHMDLVSNEVIISKIKDLITENTGVTSLSSSVATATSTSTLTDVTPIDVSNIEINEKGWILGLDNRRIKIKTTETGYILVNGAKAVESGSKVYDTFGNRIGSVWRLGDTGKKMYYLYNGEYTLKGSNYVDVGYINNGYYENRIEYLYCENIIVSIGDCTAKSINCTEDNILISSTVQPIKVYTTAELNDINTINVG